MNDPYDIEIANQQNGLDLDEAFLREVVTTTLSAEGVAAAEISLALVDQATIRRLNRDYLGRDEKTDVLSFRLSGQDDDSARTPGAVSPCTRARPLEGEVVVNVEMAVEMGAKFYWTARDEVVLYVVHGLLHLVGYDDLSAAEREEMQHREREILRTWNLEPHYERAQSP